MSQMCPDCGMDNPDDTHTCPNCDGVLRNLLGKNSLLSDRYNVVGVLGYGAMGAVYLADDTRLEGRRCAIKENRPDMKLPEKLRAQSREQFLAEASVLARLDHSKLPKVSDYFVEGESEYLVMDYVEGDDLVAVIERATEPLDEATVLDWADQVLDALEYLHNHEPQPIIHRDIKPANLRVNSRGRVKLVDFGLVKLFDPNNPETKVELRGLGTPAYAPLEQFAGSQKHTDNRSDIYALGATMYHLVTHLPPTEVHQRLLSADSLIPISELNVNISPQTEEAILKAMAIHPNERFQSAEDMRIALAAAGEAAKAAPVPVHEQAVATPSSSSGSRAMPMWILALLAVLFVLLVGGALYFFVFSRQVVQQTADQPVAQSGDAQPAQTRELLVVQPLGDAPATESGDETNAAETDPEPSPTAIPTDTPSPEPSATPTSTPEPSATPTATSVASSPSQSINPGKIPPSSLAGTIAYPVFNGTDYDLYFGQANGSGTMQFRKHASQPSFSLDGSRITFHSWLKPWGIVAMQLPDSEPIILAEFVEDQLPVFTADGSEIIYLTRREGDRKSRLVKVGSTQLNSLGAVIGEGEYPTVGATGNMVFRGWGATGNGIRLSDTSLNNPQPVTPRDEDTAPALSPDGSKVAFMSRRDGNWDIFVANADGSNPNRITSNPNEDGLPVWSPDGNAIAFVSLRDGQWGVWATLPTGEDQRLLFKMEGSPDGLVGANRNASRGWTEERISWTE